MIESRKALERIRSRGYWEIAIRPTRYIPARIAELKDLLPLIQELAIQRANLYGFPHLVEHRRPARGLHWIQDSGVYGFHIYLWRFSQSGQMYHISSMVSDWLSEGLRGAPEGWKPLTTLGIGETVWRFTDAFEFASRFASTDTGSDSIRIEMKVARLHNRLLEVDVANRLPVTGEYRTSVEEFPYEGVFGRSDLIATGRKLAVDAALRLFAVFDWDAPRELIQNYQDELTRRPDR